jgi:hypothetical protein
MVWLMSLLSGKKSLQMKGLGGVGLRDFEKLRFARRPRDLLVVTATVTLSWALESSQAWQQDTLL